MNQRGEGQPDDEKTFTEDFEKVVTTEQKYLATRRAKNVLRSLDEDPSLWGLAFSGGGVRSATFCLGVIQALTLRGRMKRFDYLSTVSGGSYIGSCLSSLLSKDAETGLDNENSPLTGLRETDEYGSPAETKLSVRHQIHHLRTHGEYLVPRSRVMSCDVQRAVGSVFSGMIYTITLFVLVFIAFAAAMHLILTVIEPDLTTLAPTVELAIDPTDGMSTLEFVKAVPREWVDERIAPPLERLWSESNQCWRTLLLMMILGGLWSLAAVVSATRLSQDFDPGMGETRQTIRAGWTSEEEREARFVRGFNLWSLVVAVSLMLVLAIRCRVLSEQDEFLPALVVPLAFAVGGLLVSHVATYVWESYLALKSWKPSAKDEQSRFRRSLYGSIRGACIYGAVAAVAVPVILIVLFSLSTLPMKFFWSLASLGVAYYASRKAGATGAIQLSGWLKRPIANIALMLFLAFAFSGISAVLLERYRTIDSDKIWLYSLVVVGSCLFLFLLLGVCIDANRTSPHYFYRDRLTEAYLKTEARVKRPEDSADQGMPLKVLRDDEDLKLSELGEDNGRSPYHLIVAAINLSGSSELNRKSFLSDHFIFSRDYIGSRVTGWVATRVYRGGSTRLARAMTISAAAVGSAMGPNTFAAQAFVTTLLNARLGFWIDNPWSYRDGLPKHKRSRPTFWPEYLFFEMFGQSSARKRLVNVSDGGHTGDNVALLPLLQRRCETIVVCDGEADGGLTFGSFNNAVRMAYIEENIEIDIDLGKVMDREEIPAGFKASAANVVVGRISYPKTSSKPKASGRLVYIKSSIPRTNVPAHVANYAKANADFPHETTADQFFNDAQFEAYRALGQNLGSLAADLLDQKQVSCSSP